MNARTHIDPADVTAWDKIAADQAAEKARFDEMLADCTDQAASQAAGLKKYGGATPAPGEIDRDAAFTSEGKPRRGW